MKTGLLLKSKGRIQIFEIGLVEWGSDNEEEA